jgi:hypothetical protein
LPVFDLFLGYLDALPVLNAAAAIPCFHLTINFMKRHLIAAIKK